jgi:hypothetical protein
MDDLRRLSRDGHAIALGACMAGYLIAMFLPLLVEDDAVVLGVRLAAAALGLLVARSAYRTWPSKGTTALLIGAWAVGLGVSACLVALGVDGAGAIGTAVTFAGFLGAVYLRDRSLVR